MDHFLRSMFCVCHDILSVHCSLVVTCWDRTGHLALLYVMFYNIFFTFLCGVLGQTWYLLVSIPGICILTYFYDVTHFNVTGFITVHLCLNQVNCKNKDGYMFN